MALPTKVRDRVIARDAGACAVGGDPCTGEAQVAHHRANRGSGGAKSLDGYSNLLASCSLCNGWIEDASGDTRDELVRRGVRVTPHATHAKTAARSLATPVTYPDGTVWLLDDNGGKERVT